MSENISKLKVQHEKLLLRVKTREAEVEELSNKHDKVELVYKRLVETDKLDEEFGENRKKLKRKCTVARRQLKLALKDVDDFLAEHPEIAMEQSDESETEIIEQLQELSVPASEEKQKSLTDQAMAFTLPSDLTTDSVDHSSVVIPEASPVILTKKEEKTVEVVVDKDESIHTEDSGYYKWLEQRGMRWINAGKTLNTITGILIHELGGNLEDKFPLMQEAVDAHPRDLLNQVKYVYTRLDS